MRSTKLLAGALLACLWTPVASAQEAQDKKPPNSAPPLPAPPASTDAPPPQASASSPVATPMLAPSPVPAPAAAMQPAQDPHNTAAHDMPPTDATSTSGRKMGLMITGFAIFGGAYLSSVLSGILTKATNPNDCSSCDDASNRFFIPLAGPWLALPDVGSDVNKFVAVVQGVAQATGLTLGIVGATIYSASAPKPGASAFRHLTVSPIRGGAYGSFEASF
jgi:hypothetical protein